MKKILKMFSMLVLLVLINQNVAFASYTWKPSGGIIATTCNPINPCQALAGPDQNYCGSLCSIPDTLGAMPHSASPTSCGGTNVQYAWAPSTGLSCTTCEHPLASPAVTTTYTLTVTFPASCACDASNCMACTRTDQVTITHTTCQHCQINNLLFDPEVLNICVNVYPKKFFIPFDLNISTEIYGFQIPIELVDVKNEIESADKPKFVLLYKRL